MTRDNDLVREILQRIEASQESPLTIDRLGITSHDRVAIGYHLQLLEEAGYVVANFAYGDDAVQEAVVDRLTWAGHEFLDAIRSDTVWAKTKSTIAATVGTASLEVVKAAATAIAMKMMGL